MDNIPQMIDPSPSELADMQDTPTGSRPFSFPRELSIMAESRRCDDLLAVPSEEICALPTGSVAFSGGGNTKCSTRKNCFLAGGTVASHGLSTCPGRFIEPTGFGWSHDPLSTNSSSFPDPNPPIHKSVGPGRQDALRSSSNDCPPACLGMARPEFSRRLKIGSPSYWPSSP